jgi:hypothetical protein
VIRHLAARCAADLFGKLPGGSDYLINGFNQALYLPQDLLSHWLTTREVLDLRTTALTALQWSRLFAALMQGGLHLTEIYIRIDNLPDGYYAPCEILAGALESCIKRSDYIPKEQLVEELRSLKSDGLVKCGNDSMAQQGHIVSTLAEVLPQLTSLKHVGLLNLPMHRQLMPVLGQVLMSLPPSVTTLTLTIAASAKRDKVGLLQKSMLFNAMAWVKSLRELHMPNWEVFVGDDGACVEPLCHLPHLQAVYVTKVEQSSAYRAKLPFKAGP